MIKHNACIFLNPTKASIRKQTKNKLQLCLNVAFNKRTKYVLQYNRFHKLLFTSEVNHLGSLNKLQIYLK